MKIQLQRMHKEFGREHVHKCGECCNFWKSRKGEYCDRSLQKCLRYGMSHSDATDWAQGWEACRMFNIPLADGERPLMEYVSRKRPPAGEIPGQMMMGGEDHGTP